MKTFVCLIMSHTVYLNRISPEIAADSGGIASLITMRGFSCSNMHIDEKLTLFFFFFAPTEYIGCFTNACQSSLHRLTSSVNLHTAILAHFHQAEFLVMLKVGFWMQRWELSSKHFCKDCRWEGHAWC